MNIDDVVNVVNDLHNAMDIFRHRLEQKTDPVDIAYLYGQIDACRGAIISLTYALY